MSTVLITGANRGLGLEFTKQYVVDDWDVLATARDPDTSKELQALAKEYPKLRLLQVDVADEKSIRHLAKQVDGKPIDVLILNAGMYPRDGQKIGEIDYTGWRLAVETNVFGPMRVAEVLLPNVEASKRKQIAALSSSMSSLRAVQGASVSQSGTAYQYRTSKTALNMTMAILAKELEPRGISVVLLDPGWVQTDMGGRRAPLTPEQSIRGMRRVLAGNPNSIAGKFLVHDGSEMDW